MEDLVFGEAGGVEDQGVGRGCEGRGCARTITAVAFTQLNRGFGRHSAQMLLLQSPLFADYRVGIQEDFYIRVRENLGSDVTPFQQYAVAAHSGFKLDSRIMGQV